MLSHFSRVRLFATPRTVAHQAPLSVGLSGKNPGVSCHALLQGIFLTQEPFPSPGDLPNPGIEPRSLVLQSDSLLTELLGMYVHVNAYM